MARSQKTVKDKLDAALNVANKQLEKKGKEVEILPPAEKALEKPSRPEDFSPECQEDYEYARATYYQLIEKGQEAINGALEVAQELESPRGYEVVAVVIKSVSEVATAMINLQEKMKNLRGLRQSENADKGNSLDPQGDTYIFAGTTDAVLKIIEEGRNGKSK